MNAWCRMCGLACLAIPARRVTRPTILAAPCRSGLRSSTAVNRRPSVRSLMARSIAPGGARGERDSDDFAALAGDQQGPVPALKTEVLDVGSGRLGPRGPLSASREISACSAGRPSPAATRRPPSSLRSSAMACAARGQVARISSGLCNLIIGGTDRVLPRTRRPGSGRCYLGQGPRTSGKSAGTSWDSSCDPSQSRR